MTILCCGEALIDMIPVECHEGQAAFQPCAGGAVFNTSIALGRLGAKTEFLTGLSSDLFGRQLLETLADSGVSASLCKKRDLPTTLAFVTLKDGHASYQFFDENSAGRMLSRSDVGEIPDGVNAMFFGGISLCVEPSAQTYEALAIEQSDERVIMMDPNIRPSFIQDEDRYRTRLAAMLKHCDIVKVSDEDLAWWLPNLADNETRIRYLLDEGPGLILLTRGEYGADAYARRQLDPIHVDAVPATKVDTVGAGDTFNAGFLAKLDQMDVLTKKGVASLSETDIRSALELAVAASAVTVSRKGANPPWSHELG